MAHMMTFPDKFEDFIKEYEFIDTEETYTNGSELIQSFRVMQAWEYYMNKFKKAWEFCEGDVHIFGHHCKKILKDMGEL